MNEENKHPSPCIHEQSYAAKDGTYCVRCGAKTANIVSPSPTIKEGEQQEETVALGVKIEIYEQEIRELNYGELCVKFAKKGFRDGANWQKNQQPKGEQEEEIICSVCGWSFDSADHHQNCLNIYEKPGAATLSMETKERGEQEDWKDQAIKASCKCDIPTDRLYPFVLGFEKCYEWKSQQTTTLQAEIEELKAEREKYKGALQSVLGGILTTDYTDRLEQHQIVNIIKKALD